MVSKAARHLMRVVAHNGARIWGGAERATVMLLRGLSDRGHEVRLLCNDALVKRESEMRGVPAEMCAIGGDVAVPHAFRIARRLRRLEPDAFVVGTWKKLFLASLGARLAGVPRIVARIGLETDTPRSAKYRFALRHWVNGAAVNAARMIEPFSSLSGFGAHRVSLIHNGVRMPAVDRSRPRMRDELGIDPKALVTGFVGRLAEQKRVDRLLGAVALADASVHCIIAGEGDSRATLVATADRLGISSRVHLVGHREDVGNVLDSLDAFVVASDKEGLSNAMLEAMSLGVPVITTPVSGAADAVDGPAPAGIITGFDEASIARAIERLRGNPGERMSMSQAATRRAESTFSFSAMLDKWEAFLAA